MTEELWPSTPDPDRSSAAEPAARVSDGDREHAAELLQRACGDGRLTLEEFSERVGAVWAAETSAELAAATSGNTQPVVGSPSGGGGTQIGVLGGRRRVGRWRLPRRLRLIGLLGDWELDLRGALLDREALTAGVVDLYYFSLMGDLTVTVPEGVEVELRGFDLLGDRSLELAAVPMRPGAPRVRLHAYGLLGDVSVRSAA